MPDWRRIGFISDLHAGSLYSPFPDSYTFPGDEGVTIKASQSQIILRQYLDDFLSHEIAEADSIYFGGDMADGGNIKEHGRQLTTPELYAQVDIEVHLLSSLKGRVIRGISGSKYHQSIDTNLDRLILKDLGGEYLGVLKHIRLKDLDFVMQLAHGGSAGGVLYEGTASDRDAILMDQAQGRGKFDFNVDLIVRGHRHFYWYHETSSKKFLRLPCWKCWFPWAPMTEKYGKWQPDIGGVCIDVGPRGKVVVHKKLYPLLHIHDGMIDG